MDPVSVLLVDDNPTFLAILKRFLEQQHSHEVVILGMAGGGAEALIQAEKLRPNVVLMDLAMPGLSGLEAIPRLRAAMPGIGIIALTLLDPNGYRPPALAAGADVFVSKSTLSTDLLLTIRRVARSTRSRKEPLSRPREVST